TLNARILAIPGVQSLAYTDTTPFDFAAQSEVRVDNQAKGRGRAAVIESVSADFFPTFGIQILRGRSFRASDVSGSANVPVAVVSRSFARSFWGDADPVGKAVLTPDDRHLIVIGVAQD